MAGNRARGVLEIVRAAVFGDRNAEGRIKKEAAEIVWEEARADSSRETKELVRIAWLIVHHPKLRAAYRASRGPAQQFR